MSACGSARLGAFALAAAIAPAAVRAEGPPLLPERVAAALAREVSGESAMRDLVEITRHHRMRGSRGYRAAAEHVAARLREHGLSDAGIESLPADGRIFYGTQKTRPAWDAEFAELWEVRRERAGVFAPHVRLASWEAMPITLAQDSESAEVTREASCARFASRSARRLGHSPRRSGRT